ncbi:hypothetical protein PHYPSEUDO_002375 [Phytophthora pseudosyringae]|uniref:RxLR effector protein n=1 Tax=Phytophthora pseudosyringae TaxID=221518 RepID=A0A8T1VTB3_9STRA|nr:hypothetical protein PHYPSEUDO_002375 [Phytophthora pseudosyringae]
MRFHLVVLLAVATLLADSDAVITPASATTLISGFRSRPKSGVHGDGPATRFLRTDTARYDEERAITASKVIEWMLVPTSAQAKKLSLAEKFKVQKWVNKQKTSEYVFKRLGLNGGVENVLTNPKLHLYSAYIDRFNAQHPAKKANMVDMFTTTYGDAAVLKLLEKGTSPKGTEKFVSRFRIDLANSWVTSGKSAEDVFTLLKLDKTGYKIFTGPQTSKEVANPALQLYAAYLDGFNQKFPEKKMEMLAMFRKTYGDNGVAEMAELGMKVPSTSNIASILRKELLNSWRGKEDDAEHVFKALKLDHAGDDLLATPQLNTLFSYIKMTYDRKPEDVMNNVLAKHYGYDDLSRIFIHGQRRIDLLETLPMRLENAMVNRWLRKEEPPSDIFSFLLLDEGVDKLLTNPNMRMWESYTAKFNAKNANDVPVTMMQTLTKFYSYKDLSGMLEKAKNVPSTATIAKKWQSELRAQQWLDDGLSANAVFEVLKLDGGVEKLLTNPNLRVWENYRTLFNSQKPEDTTTMMQTLLKFYSYKTLSDMLEKAKDMPATAKIAAEWQLQLKAQRLGAIRIKWL